MSSAFNHKTRSRKTYKYRMAAARYYCNNTMTRLDRLLMMSQMRGLLKPEEKNEQS